MAMKKAMKAALGKLAKGVVKTKQAGVKARPAAAVRMKPAGVPSPQRKSWMDEDAGFF